MTYANYLRDRSSDCISLAVDRPWASDVDTLIDMAVDYRTWAGQVGEAEMSRAGEPDGVWRGARLRG